VGAATIMAVALALAFFMRTSLQARYMPAKKEKSCKKEPKLPLMNIQPKLNIHLR